MMKRGTPLLLGIAAMLMVSSTAIHAIELPVTSGLICRFDGDHVEMDPAMPGFVKTLLDQSGRGNDAFDPNGDVRQPYLRSDALAGHAVLEMNRDVDGNDDGYYNVMIVAPNGTDFDSTTFTWFMVYKPGRQASTTLINSTYTSPVNTSRFWGTYNDTRMISNARTSTGGSVAEIGAVGDGLSADWHLLAAVWDSSATVTVDGDVDQYIDGEKSPAGATTATATTVSGHIGTAIGSDIGGSAGSYSYANFFGGQIAEVLIYNVALTAEQIDQVSSYLANKYGLDTTYPATTCAGLWGKGLGMATDLSQDCIVNLEDFALFTLSWQDCYDTVGCN